ncbi:efflux RND transporter periplasmic adaptor subunit [Alteromonas sp. ASW11-36]|uniref:Efflux RND transporter periplasmic adaptor subunit n=1 Tax=Alteromonas arenosi TaxID=3055817 RepID=A0ABT7SW90_9ALTE|nr:efflux RND transporter periplasmic adaptor subunit [Alteromonas sp. ASW11-36]MDM7860457.1 efflux RND transporter periplasmic adaptor subunit [Alteromonas sp. ASW11-36]
MFSNIQTSRIKFFSLYLGLLCLFAATPSIAQWQGADRPKLVVVEPLSFEFERTQIEAVGSAQARRSVTLFPSVADEVVAVYFVPGQKVSAGQKLLELDSRLQNVAIKRAEIQLKEAQRNYSRARQSLAKGAITQSEVEVAETQQQLAEVALQEAQENLADRIVRAPFAGIVGLTDIEVGDRITPQTPITTLDDRSELFVNFVAPEMAVPYLINQPEVVLQPWTDRALQLTAQIAEVDTRVDTSDRTIRVRALLNNASDTFRPGMSFRVSLNVRGNRYVSIPEAALSWGVTGAYVWLAQDNSAKRVSVEVEQRLRGRILVSGALSDGQTLITEGIQGLREGQSLRIQNSQNATLKREQDDSGANANG